MTSRRSFELPASAFSSLCLLISLEACAQNSIDRTNGWWSPFTITGYAEAYYDVDFNKPPDNRKNPHFSLNKIPAKTSSPRYIAFTFLEAMFLLTFLSIIVSRKTL
jgi:hypothetical protein